MKLSQLTFYTVIFFILVSFNLYSEKIIITDKDIIGRWKMIYSDKCWGDMRLTLDEDVLLIARDKQSGKLVLENPLTKVVVNGRAPVELKTISVRENIINAVFINLPEQPSGNDIEYTGTMTGDKKIIVLWPLSEQGQINAHK
ncbi:hypothetical protein [Endozoicomonas sp. Mp262]|uniref:hypothetical protein n=1 Tax=Endozoicomonas sp. Mp262 TaxID=2919499 RepID=UPI0021E05FE7